MENQVDNEELQYLNLVKDIISTGYNQSDRTGVGTKTKVGVQMKFNLRDNKLPVITTRRTFFRGAVEELLWFLRGETDITSMKNNNIHIWDGNTTEEFIRNRKLEGIVPTNSVGTLYGYQIRNWNGDWIEWRDNGKRTGIDQLAKIISLLKNDPESRRILISNYNVEQTETGVLEPCHTLYSFNVDAEKKELHSLLWMRSADFMCGVPLNILHISLLTHILAKLLGYTAGEFTFQAANAHVYNNHIPDANTQISRSPFPFPSLEIIPKIDSIEDIENLKFEDFVLSNYKCHEPIKYEMAI
ncbi:MAG: thymidylate synthase [Crocinitomicaceae bacterium]|nr:thymidylate synthase [Crocinitomicaceae bacterium]